MPYKIAVTVTNDLIQDQRMHRICTSLRTAGHDVVLVGRERSSSVGLLNQNFDQKRLKCWFDKGVLFYLEYNLRLFLLLMTMKVDLLYSVDLDTLGSLGLVSLLRNKKLVYDAHEYFIEVPELQNSSFKKWFWNLIGVIFIPKSNLCITVNEELAVVLKDKYHHDFEVVRSVPVLLSDMDRQSPSDTRIILYQGVLNRGRGLEEAIRWISKSNKNIELHIVGEGDLSTELRELKSEIDKNNRVQFLGWKKPTELDAITTNAWLGLNLLDGQSLNYKYSLANKFFNYMHAGVPSVNMDFPVYARYCKEDNVGICIPDLSMESLDRAIIPLLTNEKKYIEMVEATKSARLRYAWQVEEVKLLDLINKTMEV